MKIQNTPSQQTFQAKFLYSDSLKQIADYAVEHNKCEKLNTARKNIERSYLTTRLRADIYENEEGKKFISFSKFIPKKNVLVAKNQDDYIMAKTTTYESNKKGSLLKFGLEQIIKLGNNAPNNKMYKYVVIEK